MLSPEQLELYTKYEKDIDEFLSLKKISDDVLFNSLKSCSELITGYADNIKHFAEQGQLDGIDNSLKDLLDTIDIMSNNSREARRRAEKLNNEQIREEQDADI